MYTNSSKYVSPPKRANWVKPTPLPKNKQVTFQEPPRTSNRPTQKPPVQQNKKPNVPVNLSTRTKLATESRKPMPTSHTRNHRILPSKSVNARRAANHNRKLNVVDHNQFVIRSMKSLGDQLERLLVVLSLSGNPMDDISRCSLIANLVIERLVPRGYLVFLNAKALSFGHPVANSITERLKRATTYVLRKIDFSLLSRTASIQESGTSVLEDLKALRWKTYQEEQTATGKEISNPFLADSLLKTILFILKESVKRHMLTLQDLKKSRKLSLQSFHTSELMSSSNVKVMKSRRRKITKAFRITTNMSMSDHSSANGKMKKRSHIIQEIRDQDQVIKTSNSSSRDQDQVIKTSNSSSRDQDQVIKTSNSSSKDQDQVSKIGLLLKHKYIK
ncbi:hypothetical protein Tco_0237474 [Tanacetum coccineum]